MNPKANATTTTTTIRTTTTTTITDRTKSFILSLIKENNQITIKEIANILGLSKEGVVYSLNKMKHDGIIQRQGASYGGYWVLNNEQEDTPVVERSEKKCANNVGQNVGQYVGQSAEETKDQELELKIRDCISKNNRISKRQIALLAGVSEKTIERLMKKLPNIKYIGHGKGGHWEIINK